MISHIAVINYQNKNHPYSAQTHDLHFFSAAQSAANASIEVVIVTAWPAWSLSTICSRQSLIWSALWLPTV